jgi:hypothetical protein
MRILHHHVVIDPSLSRRDHDLRERAGAHGLRRLVQDRYLYGTLPAGGKSKTEIGDWMARYGKIDRTSKDAGAIAYGPISFKGLIVRGKQHVVTVGQLSMDGMGVRIVLRLVGQLAAGAVCD